MTSQPFLDRFLRLGSSTLRVLLSVWLVCLSTYGLFLGLYSVAIKGHPRIRTILSPDVLRNKQHQEMTLVQNPKDLSGYSTSAGQLPNRRHVARGKLSGDSIPLSKIIAKRAVLP